MKIRKSLALILLTGMISSAMLGAAWADLAGIVQQFGQQRQLIYTKSGDQSKLTSMTPIDLSAYANNVLKTGGNTFVSFCVDPGDTVNTNVLYTAHLDYNAVAGTTSNSHGKALTNGVAWLYKTFVTAANLSSFDYGAFQATVNSLVKNETLANNIYTTTLLANMSEAQARTTYQVGNSAITGEYAVFVVQLNNGGTPAQDFIYVAHNPISSSVPEPATILFWTLGSFGALGSAFLKKRRNLASKLA
ncbi:MAG: hypothetical protein LBT05_16790 [Planctomycetaceae bacterium]|jgi:hypothetical protein|nr:hypothetical protein [Planctomycetaceae bacterium]